MSTISRFRVIYAIIIWFFTAILVVQCIYFWFNNRDLSGLKVRVENINDSNSFKKNHIVELERQIDMYENDQSVLEEQARSDLLMKRKDETLFQYVDV